MQPSILSKILFALQILSLEYFEDSGQLKSIGYPPPWAQEEFSCFGTTSTADQAATNFPESTFEAGEFSLFLDNFLFDAVEFWQDCPTSFLRSGLWSEVGRSGKEVRLEAVALYLERRRILLIESSDSKYSERFKWLQTARQERLSFISERKIAETQLMGAKFYDALTGLPNQTFFLSQLTNRFEQLQHHSPQHHSPQHFAVLVLNLDRFQILNDSLGHSTGDRLLRAVAERLKGCLRPNDIPVRFGSDEFGILLHEVQNEADALAIAQRVNRKLQQGFRWDALGLDWTDPEPSSGKELMITASVGIAVSEHDRYSTPRELLRNASIAMHQAKALDRGRSVLFERQMHARAFKLWRLETDLHRALEAGELEVWYQPIISLKTHRVDSFEALIRWHHPEQGWIAPSEFVPLAEDTGFILDLDYWTLREACRTLQKWQFRSQQPLSMNVNLSSRHFGKADLPERIQHILSETGAQPQWLNLEMTESLLLTDIQTTTAHLKQLRQLGIQMSIDDFGTGYASFSYLQDLPVDKLKIDGYFIDMMLENGTEIVSTIIQLAHRLNLDVTAERVETLAQYRALEAQGCDYVQGYWMAKPMPQAQAIALINQDFRPENRPENGPDDESETQLNLSAH